MAALTWEAILKVDVDRSKKIERDATGIFIRAQWPDERWDTVDIAWLTKGSLLQFLKSRGGKNKWAEDCCGIILGHGHLHKLPPSVQSEIEK